MSLRTNLMTVGVFALGLSAVASAAPITFNASGPSVSSGATLAASVNFAVSGTNLIVTLSNTGASDVLVQGDILTAVFFDISGPALNLTSTSAVLANGSSVLFGPVDPGNVVGGEWGYASAISGALSAGTGGFASQNYGISSSGFGIFGGATFPGTNLDPPAALDGVNYGITAVGDNPATGQSAVSGSIPLIQSSVVFTLSGLPIGFDPAASITSAYFQYGTALAPKDTGFNVPEPTTLGLLSLGALVGLRRRS